MDVSIQRILFPTDFSEPAKQAQEYAKALAHHFDAELHLLHVLQPLLLNPHPATPWLTAENEMRLQMDLADQRLGRELCQEWSQQHRTVCTTVVGFSIEEILKYVNVHKIDLIVMGTHGHTGLSHFVMGSVAEKVVRTANCPVMTVHPHGHQFVDAQADQKALSGV